LYEDKRCLEQIHAAIKVSERSEDDICIIPLRFDETVVAPEDRWESVKWAHNKKLDKMLELTNEALSYASPLPQSGTIPESSKHLMTMLQILGGKQRRMVNWTPTHSPWETADHDAAWVGNWFNDMGFEPPPTREDEDSEEEEPTPKKKGGIIGRIRKSMHRTKSKLLDDENPFGSEEVKEKRKSVTSQKSTGTKSALASNPFGSMKKQKSVGFKNFDIEPTASAPKKRGPSVWGGLFGGGGKKDDKPQEDIGDTGFGDLSFDNNAADEESGGGKKKEEPPQSTGMFGKLFASTPAKEPEKKKEPEKQKEPEPVKKGLLGGMFSGVSNAFGYGGVDAAVHGAQAPKDEYPPVAEDDDDDRNLVIQVGDDQATEVGLDTGNSEEVEDTSWMDVDEKDPDVKEWRTKTMTIFDGPGKNVSNTKSEPVKKKLNSPSAKALGKACSEEAGANPKKKAAKSKAKALPKQALTSPSVKAKASPKKAQSADSVLGPAAESEAESGTDIGDFGSMFQSSQTAPAASAKKTAKSKAKAKAKS
jgi:hypothetical protein